MAALSTDVPFAVVGAGTMGAGIAQVAAAAGHPVLLCDAVPGAADRFCHDHTDRACNQFCLDALSRFESVTDQPCGSASL